MSRKISYETYLIQMGHTPSGVKSYLCQWLLKFSGANHSCIIVREDEVIQTAYNHTGISLLTPIDYGFTETTYPIEKGDSIYLFTDGYPDQFGGSTIEIRNAGGKKFKYKQLIELLKSNKDKDVFEQRLHLLDSIKSWMGDLEQVDDICILGIKFRGGVTILVINRWIIRWIITSFNISFLRFSSET